MLKAYLGIKYHPDNRNRATIEAISNTLIEAGFQTTCIVRDVEHWGQHKFSPQELMTRTFAVIDQSDLAIIELSEKGVGLGIEAGYAYAHKVPLVTIAREGSDISTTLRGISDQVFTYGHFAELVAYWSNLYQKLC